MGSSIIIYLVISILFSLLLGAIFKRLKKPTKPKTLIGRINEHHNARCAPCNRHSRNRTRVQQRYGDK